MFLSMTATMVPVYLVLMAARPQACAGWKRLWYLGATRICALDVEVNGRPVEDEGVVYVVNHVSYLDIPVLGTLLDATFVAKREVATWPLFGFLARLINTVFVSRDPRGARGELEEMRRRIAAKESLVLFPEGTSSDGHRVLPFYSTFFAAFERHREDAVQARIQPVSIAYPRYRDGRPLTGPLARLYAWYGDMTLVDHLLTVFGLEGCRVVVTFHAPIDPADFPSRKALAAHCQATVAHGVATAHRRPIGPIPGRKAYADAVA